MSRTNPRAARVAALIQRVVATSLESRLRDKRLAGVTITDVRVTNDLQIARVFWTQIGREGHEQGERRRAQQALDQANGRLRARVGATAGLRLTPELRFIYDELPAAAHEIDDALTVAHRRDAELESARRHARYAGGEDPYRHDDDDRHDDDHSSDGSDGGIPDDHSA